MNPIDLLSRYAHVLTATVFVGGAVFLRAVLNPTLEDGADPAFDDHRAAVREGVRRRWMTWVGAATLVLIASGLWNYLAVSLPRHKGDGPYHALMGVKMLLALVAFFLAAALSGRSAKLQPIRDGWRTSGAVLVLTLAGVVFVGSYLKMRGVPADLKPVADPSAAAT